MWLGALVAIEEESRFVVGSISMQIFSEILLFIFEIAVIDVLFLFFSVWQQASSGVKFYIVCRKNIHCFHHLLMRFEVDEKTTLRVDEVMHDSRWNVFERSFRL